MKGGKQFITIMVAWGLLQFVSSGTAKTLPDFISLEERTEQRMRKIVIPRLELKDTTLAEALAILKRDAVECDPKHIGVRMDSQLGPDSTPTSKTLFPEEELRRALDTKITISLTNVQLIEGIRYVTALAECRFVFTPEGVELAPNSLQTDTIETRTIPLPAVIFERSAKPERFGIPRSEIQTMRSDLQQYLTNQGVQFNGRASCAFDASGMTMILTNTMDQLDVAHAVLTSLLHRKDVLIDKKFKVPGKYLVVPGLESAHVEDSDWKIPSGISFATGPSVIFIPSKSIIIARTTKKGHRDIAAHVREAWREFRDSALKGNERTHGASSLWVKEYVVPKNYEVLLDVKPRKEMNWGMSSETPFVAGPSTLFIASENLIIARQNADGHRMIADHVRELWKKYREKVTQEKRRRHDP